MAAGLTGEFSSEQCTECWYETVMLQVVIGNILETRKTEVVVVTAGGEKWLRIENATTEEIEQLIVDELVLRHTAHISSS